MDPEQRIICEVGWNALQSAGYQADILRRDAAHVGVALRLQLQWHIGINRKSLTNNRNQQCNTCQFIGEKRKVIARLRHILCKGRCVEP